MKKIKHIVFWLVVVGLILLLFSSHVIAEDIFQRQRQELINIIKVDVVETLDFLEQGGLMNGCSTPLARCQDMNLFPLINVP